MTELTAAAAHSNRNKLVFETATPTLERFNSNSNVYRVGLQHLFPVDQFQIGPVASFLYSNHDGSDSTTLKLSPAEDARWAAEVFAQIRAKFERDLEHTISGVFEHENRRPANE